MWLLIAPQVLKWGLKIAIAPAKEALIVTTPEIASVRDADRVVGLLEAQGVKRIHLIINRIKPAMVRANDMMSVQDVQELLAIPLIGVIPDDERVIVSTNRGEPLVLAETPSLAATAFDNIARRLEGETVDFLELDSPSDSIFSRLRRLLWTKIIWYFSPSVHT